MQAVFWLASLAHTPIFMFIEDGDDDDIVMWEATEEDVSQNPARKDTLMGV